MADVMSEEMALSQIVTDGFRRYHQAFRQCTHGAKARFEHRQWKEQRQALQERTELLERVVAQTALQLQTNFIPTGEPGKSLMLQNAFLAQVDKANQAMAHCFWQALLPQLLSTCWYDQVAQPQTTFPIAEEELRGYKEDASSQRLVQRLLTEIG